MQKLLYHIKNHLNKQYIFAILFLSDIISFQ